MYYKYKQNQTGLAIGSDGLALLRPHGPILGGTYGPRYNVKRNIDILRPAFIQEGQALPSIDLRGQGAYLSGEMALQKLSDFEKEKPK